VGDGVLEQVLGGSEKGKKEFKANEKKQNLAAKQEGIPTISRGGGQGSDGESELVLMRGPRNKGP